MLWNPQNISGVLQHFNILVLWGLIGRCMHDENMGSSLHFNLLTAAPLECKLEPILI